jgi:drug/metabolite transporter (DMT)-like permease
MEEEMSRILSNPINTSILSGSVVFILSFCFLQRTRPEFIITLDENNKPVIDYFKLVIISMLLGCGTAVCIFLAIYNKNPIIEKSHNDGYATNFGFNRRMHFSF